MTTTFIITAGGIGKRMGSILPKQFICVNGKPILLLTLERFYQADPNAQLLLTLPSDWLSYWEELLQNFSVDIPHEVVSGGIERYDSIKNALAKSIGEVIAVHDGVRPFVSKETIKKCIEEAHKNGCAIPFLPIKESIRKIDTNSSISVLRSAYVTVQTPQCFQASILKKAYQQPFHEGITDDASLVEQLGSPIHLVLGNEENIKITTPFDLKIAEILA